MDRSRPVRSASFGSSGPRQGANTVEDRTQPIAGSYGLARPAKTGWHSAERSIHGKDRVGSRASVTRTSSPSSRHLISPLTVLRELRRCRLAWRSPPTRSHGGSQGFKSPHLHPTTALVTGLADHFRRAGAVPGSRSGQQTGSNREQNGQPLLDCGQETKRSGHIPDLPDCETDARRQPGQLQTELACSRRMPRRSRPIQTGPVGSPGRSAPWWV